MINYIYIMHKAQESTTACSSVLLLRGGQPPSGACNQDSQSLIRKGPCGLCSFPAKRWAALLPGAGPWNPILPSCPLRFQASLMPARPCSSSPARLGPEHATVPGLGHLPSLRQVYTAGQQGMQRSPGEVCRRHIMWKKQIFQGCGEGATRFLIL